MNCFTVVRVDPESILESLTVRQKYTLYLHTNYYLDVNQPIGMLFRGGRNPHEQALHTDNNLFIYIYFIFLIIYYHC